VHFPPELLTRRLAGCPIQALLGWERRELDPANSLTRNHAIIPSCTTPHRSAPSPPAPSAPLRLASWGLARRLPPP